MLYTIVEKTEMQKCQDNGKCECMCNDRIIKWNNNETKAILKVHHECECCSIQTYMLTEKNINLLLKNDAEWINKSIV